MITHDGYSRPVPPNTIVTIYRRCEIVFYNVIIKETVESGWIWSDNGGYGRGTSGLDIIGYSITGTHNTSSLIEKLDSLSNEISAVRGCDNIEDLIAIVRELAVTVDAIKRS